ncbi:MAG: deiodinase [Planctomycetes bacterium]|nr:deiodinase [Planctomycetota bacterium]
MYIREAHPSDGWQMPQNQKDGVVYKDPKTEEEREEVASDCVKSLKLPIPCLIDDMKNTAGTAYSGWPDRIYIVGTDGRIVYKGDPGPKGFDVEAAREKFKALVK